MTQVFGSPAFREEVNGWDNTVTLIPLTEEVTFHWSTEHGKCHECGLPAAFFAPELYGKTEDVNSENKLCAVCAANASVDGERIERISR